MEKVDRPLGPVDIAGTSLTDEEVKILQNPMVGMVILFTRNYENREQLHNLTHDIHSLRNPSLLIGVDHEGGRIQRFREEFTKIPSARSLGQLYESAKSSQSDSCLRFSDGF
jgi:beta-N-acetylhexosaminidase